MPKQRNPFLFRNNSGELSQDREIARRVENLKRAPISVYNRQLNINVEKPRKPFNPTIPVYGPVGNPAGGKLLTALYDDSGGAHIYEILADDTVVELSTTGLPSGFGFAVYVQFTWSGGYWWISGYNAGFTAYAIYKSVDGSTWEASYEVFDELGVWHPVADLNGRFWRANYQQTSAFPNRTNNFWIYKSEDNGITWEQSFFFTETGLNAEVEDMTDLSGVAVHPTDGDTIAFLVSEGNDNTESVGIIITTDGGESWTHYKLSTSLYGGSHQNTGAGCNLTWLNNGTLILCVEGKGAGPQFPDPGSSDVVYGLSSSNPSGGAGTWSSFEIFDFRDYYPDGGWGAGADPINGALQSVEDKLICTYGPGDSNWPGPAGSGSLSFWSEDRGQTWHVIETPWTSWMCSNAWYCASRNKIYIVAEDTFDSDQVYLLTAEWGSSVFTPIHSFGSRFDLSPWYGICTAESNA